MNAKQQGTLERFTSAVTKRNLDPKPEFEATEENGNVILMSQGWPSVVIGKQGGITLPEIRSYADPFEAAVNGNDVLAKQQEKDKKRSEALRAAAAAPKKTEKKVDGEAPVDGEAKEEETTEEEVEAQSEDEKAAFQTGADGKDGNGREKGGRRRGRKHEATEEVHAA